MQLLANSLFIQTGTKKSIQRLSRAGFLRHTRYALLILGATCTVGRAVAAEPVMRVESQATLSLQQAQAQALQQQPLQQLWQQRQQLAQANIKQSGLRTNPEVSLTQTGFNGRDEQELSIGISQQLDLFGERKTRQALAVIGLQQQDLLRQHDEAALKLLVAVAYWQLAQAEWQLTLLHQQQGLSQQVLNVAKKRLAAGRIAQVDYQRIELAHYAQLQQIQADQAQYQMARM